MHYVLNCISIQLNNINTLIITFTYKKINAYDIRHTFYCLFSEIFIFSVVY